MTNLTRRGLLQGSASALAMGILPAAKALAGEQVSPVMARLSSYMAEAKDHALPPEVVEKTKQIVLDTFAAMISGSDLPPGKLAIQLARLHSGEKVATVAGSNVLCGPIEAAQSNGMLAHSDETDDSHSPSLSHPGCSVVPVALAASEQFDGDGTRFLRAVALGYDIGPRMTMTLGRDIAMTEGHKSTHSIAGTFGSAAAGACVAGFGAQQMRWLLDYTAQQASGIASWQRDTDHIEKAFVFGGMPARNGITATLLVQVGGTGVDDVLSGADNYLLANAPKADPAMLIDKLGERYEVMRDNFKKWTVGSPIQAPLDALQNIMKRRPLDPEQVRQISVRVATNEASVVNNRDIPDICLQHMMAVMLIDGTATFKSAHDIKRMKDPAVLRQRAKVQLIPDAELQRNLPARQAIVEVTLSDGMKLTERVNGVRGTVENPMTREEVIDKARDLIVPVLGAATSSKLIQTVFEIEKIKSLRDLRPLLQRA
ncbi:MAG TPA: MmgE/PrpD family protein [Bryobacteraceae bacterium]|jgi:2-methylcitrate dehydratase PrpD